MSRGKARCKSPFLARQLSVFSAPVNYGVVKIVCSSSEVVLLTIEHTMFFPGTCPSLEVVALRPANYKAHYEQRLQGVCRELKMFTL
jgi:hypothetical protein